MASLSRIVLKDCKLGTYDAVYRPSSSFPARKLQTYLDVRDGFPAAKNGRCCTIRNRPWSPIVALTPPSLIVQTSRVQHAFREVNRVADALAKQGCVMQEDFVILDISPSDVISSFVYSNANEESFCRIAATNLAILA